MHIRRIPIILVAFFAFVSIAANQSDIQKKASDDLLAGRNVNMVSGDVLPGGDPWLQRQNEPSIAVSTRNTQHLLAGANDYRTVDISDDFELPGINETAAGDAWLGVFKSYDGGKSWVSTLLPGFPQDISVEGNLSPLKGYQAAADPVVRAGTDGMFYFAGIAFNRDRTKSVVFISRFIDQNNSERRDSIEYIDTHIVQSFDFPPGEAEKFIDKPWIAVDVPRGDSTLMTINTQNVYPQDLYAGNIYISWSVFGLTGDLRSGIYFSRSTNGGTSWSDPVRLDEGDALVSGKGNDKKKEPSVGAVQGSAIGVDRRGNGHVYVVWREFGTGSDPVHSIYVARSTNSGKKFNQVYKVATFNSFDQGSSNLMFRTNSYPTVTVDDRGNVFVAWSERVDIDDSRIMLTTSKNGNKWSNPQAIDGVNAQGHQFMPTMTFASGKLVMAWLDQREDASGEYSEYIDEVHLTRRTIDVRAAWADSGTNPQFGDSIQVSRYLFALMPDGSAQQVQFNPPNYPLFKNGTQPFIGDYLDIAPSPMFVSDGYGNWSFNTEFSDTPIFHVAWTDNRDVKPPFDNIGWQNYSPPIPDPNSGQPPSPNSCDPDTTGMRNQNIYTSRITKGVSIGIPGNSKPLGTLENSSIPRTFVIYVNNDGEYIKSFRLSISAPSEIFASFLEFETQTELDMAVAPHSSISRPVFVASPNPKDSVIVNVVEIDMPGGVAIPNGYNGSAVINPLANNPDPGDDLLGTEYHTPNIINPNIINPNIINPNIINPNIINWNELAGPGEEGYINPNIINPNIINPNIINPNIINPNIINPNIINPNIINQTIINPNIINPNIINPNIINPNIINPNIINPNIINPNIINPNIINASVTDVIMGAQNDGNTTSSYTLKTLSTLSFPKGIETQLIVYRVHYTPQSDGCVLKMEPHFEQVVNIANPNIINPNIINPNIINPNIINSSLENATFYLGPGEEAVIDLRIIDPESQTTRIMANGEVFRIQSLLNDIEFALTDQSVESEDVAEGKTEPKFSASSLMIGTEIFLPDGVVNSAIPYAATLSASGGIEPYAWWINSGELPPGLQLDSVTGMIYGTPSLDPDVITYPAIYGFIVEVMDNLGATDTEKFYITINSEANPTPPLTIQTTSLPNAVKDAYYGVNLIATGGVSPRTWQLLFGSLPSGLSLDSSGAISGTPNTEGTFNFTVRVLDSSLPTPSSSDQVLSIIVNEFTNPDVLITGTVYGGATGLGGVLMHGLPNEPETASNGVYSVNVPYGWSGTVTPYKQDYYFTPDHIDYISITSNQTLQDYNATSSGDDSLASFVVDAPDTAYPGIPFSMTVTAQDAGGNATTNLTGDTSLEVNIGTISPDVIAEALLTDDGVWTGDVTLPDTGNVTITATNTGITGGDTIVVNTFPEVYFTLPTSSGDESVNPANLELSLSSIMPVDVTVQYETTGGDADEGDYSLPPGTATITQGNTTTNIPITVGDDELDELDETIEVTISTPTNAVLGANTVHTYTLEDNDASPIVGFQTSSSSPGSETVSSVDIPVSIPTESGLEVSVQYAVKTSSTATGGGVDFTLEGSGTAIIPVGSTSTNISLTIVNDTEDESDEIIILELSNPINATLGDLEHTYEILDNDYTLTISMDPTGTGTGTVTSVPGDIDCGVVCSDSYEEGTSVSLTATPDGNSKFVEWSDDLVSTDFTDSIVMNGPRNVTATFDLKSYTITASAGVNGSITPSGGVVVNHGNSQSFSIAPDTGYHIEDVVVDTVSQGAISSYEFTDVQANHDISATFAIDTYTLTVNTIGSGWGDVTLNPFGGTYTHGQTVELQANPTSASHFVGWSGDLTGSTNPDSIVMDGNKSVTATIDINTYTLNIYTAGSGSGGVNLDPPGGTYDHGTSVSLTADPDADSDFAGWSGDIGGSTNPTSIVMNGERSVTATFNLKTYTLSVNTAGTGWGDVLLNPSGGTYTHGQSVQLTADPTDASNFVGWSGDLSGSVNPETIIMNGPKTVTATFEIKTYTLTVLTSGAGTGSVAETVGGSPSTSPYDHGTTVTLAANPDPGSGFVNWLGDLSGTTNPNTISMTGNRTVTAVFDTISVTISGTVDTGAGSGSGMMTIESLEGVLMDGFPGSPVLTEPNGDYTVEVPYDWSGTVIPRKIGYIFEPVQMQYTNVVSNQVAQNYEGVEGWAAFYDGGMSPSDFDIAQTLATDLSGNVYISGYSGGDTFDEMNAATIKYNGNDGDELWVTCSPNWQDIPMDMAVFRNASGSDFAYITGHNSNTQRFVTLKYAGPDGNAEWGGGVFYNNEGVGQEHGANDIFVDSWGDVYVTGSVDDDDAPTVYDFRYAVIKYNGVTGNQIWTSKFGDGPDDNPSDLVVDSLGNVYVTGSSSNGSDSDFLTVKFDRDGNYIWNERIDSEEGDDGARVIVFDPSGFLFVAGYVSTATVGKDYAVMKYDLDGNKAWSSYVTDGGQNHFDDMPTGMAIDGSGNIYVTGRSDTNGLDNNNFLTARFEDYGSVGLISWAVEYDGTGGQDDAAEAIAIDPFGNIYVAGRSIGIYGNYDFVTIKYKDNGEEYTEKWTRRFDAGYGGDQATDMALDTFGDIYVTGYSAAETTSTDYATIGYQQVFTSLVFKSTTLQNTIAGIPYAVSLDAFGGDGTVRTWTHTGGILPTGLTLESTTGILSGTPTTSDPFNFEITVSDGTYTTPQSFNLTIGSGTAAYFKVTGDGSPQMTGTEIELTVTAYDISHNVATYNGDRNLQFWGPTVAYDGTFPSVEGLDIDGSPIIVHFTDGISDLGTATLIAVKAESKSVDVTDGIINSYGDESYDFDFVAIPGNTSGADSEIKALPNPVEVGNTVIITVTAYDQFWNLRGTGGETVVVDVSGANSATPAITDNGNGTYHAFYTPGVSGLDIISGTISSQAFGRDLEGASDGIINMTVNAPPEPEIDIWQDTTQIDDGDSFDFGSLDIGTDTYVIFTIQNTGTANLTLTTPLSITGTDAAEFSVQDHPTSPITAGGDDTFTIRFSPTSGDAKTALISINNNDPDEDPYDINLSGTGVDQFTDITPHDWPLSAIQASSAAWGDYDNDGDLDIFICFYDNHWKNILYRNDGNATFTYSTSGDMAIDNSKSTDASWGDYDNDGYLDLYLTSVRQTSHGDRLYKNNGDGSFTKITTGIIFEDADAYSCSWVDYDCDGYLDLFVVTSGLNRLHHNERDGTFTRIWPGVLVEDIENSRSCSWGDYDSDGDPDVVVVNIGSNSLYRNDGNGVFTKILTGPIVEDSDDGDGSCWGDYNNDGYLDLFVANMNNQNNCLYQNNQDGTFTKITVGSVVSDGGNSSSGNWVDYDNDGDLDLFVANRGLFDVNFLYQNNGSGDFARISNGAIVNLSGNQSSWGDFDNDGDLDLLISTRITTGDPLDHACYLFQNNGTGNNWINIKCEGTSSNISAIGAKVKVRAIIGGEDSWQLHEISGGTHPQESLNAEFGLGDASEIAEIQVYWTFGQMTTMASVAPNQFLVITEPALPAPTLSDVTPNQGNHTNSALNVSVSGSGFCNGANVELNFNGEDAIPATLVTFVDQTQLDCVFDLTLASDHLGEAWDVKVTNPGGNSGILEDNFTIYRPDPYVSSLDPNSGIVGTVVNSTIQGTGFVTGASVKLTKSGESDIDASGISVDSETEITCDFDLTGAATGDWNVVVTVPEAENPGVLSSAFTVNVLPEPEMNIRYFATNIPSGGSYDFGTHASGANVDIEFTIENIGTSTLILTDPPIEIFGPNQDQFSLISAQPALSIAPFSSETFTIRFSPTSGGAKIAAISIGNDDADEDPYGITFNGFGVYQVGGDYFNNRLDLTIDSTKIDETLNYFPVLVRLNSSHINFNDFQQTSGEDIRFYPDIDPNGSAQGGMLEWEIERFDIGNEVAEIWVEVPQVSSAVDTKIYMFYGNDSVPDVQNVAGTWSGTAQQYELIQHLQETTGIHADSSTNAHDGTPSGSMNLDAVGIVAGADSFDGVDDYVDFGHHNDFQGSSGTYEAWIKPEAGLSDQYFILSKSWDSAQVGRKLSMTPEGQAQMQMFDIEWHSASDPWPPDIEMDEWYHVAGVWGFLGLRLYVNGEEIASIPGYTANGLGGTLSLILGNWKEQLDLGETQYSFKGTIDEVRVSTIGRSAAWLKATYHSIAGTLTIINPFGLDHIIVSPSTRDIMAGDIQRYTVDGYDANNNFVGDVTSECLLSIDAGAGGSWSSDEYTSEVSGTWTVTASHPNPSILDATATLNVIGGAAAYFKVTGNSTASAGEGKELTITAYDSFHNVATYNGDRTLTFSGLGTAPDGTPPTVEGIPFGSDTVVHFTDGVSDANAATVIATLVETVSVDVTDGTRDSYGDEAYDYDLVVVPGNTTEAATEISVSPNPVDVGNLGTITVTAYDQFWNPIGIGGDTVFINVSGANPGTPAVADNGNGTYTATYIPSVGGTDNISGTINSAAIGRDNDGVSDGIFNLTINMPSAPEMDVRQDASPIADGGVYGYSSQNIGTDTDAVFTIENNGTANLSITTPLSISGADASEFSVQANPSSSVAAGGNTTFTIRFSPTSDGIKTASIAIGNNDADENPYDITLNAVGVMNYAWIKQFNDSASDSDYAKDIAIDVWGNVYVTGDGRDSTTSWDITTIKYDSAGVEKWRESYNGELPSNSIEYGHAIAVDALGNVYVAGQTDEVGNTDYVTIKYDTNGVKQWARNYDGIGGWLDRAVDIAVDANGYVYVTGKSASSGGGGNFEYATLKYDAIGNLLWDAHCNESGDDEPRGLAVDHEGNVYVTGEALLPSSSTGKYMTVKYDRFGTQIFRNPYTRSGWDAAAFAIAVDDSGNSYVTGISNLETTSDIVTIKYGPFGGLLWDEIYTGAGNYVDCGYAITVDSAGYVYVGGKSPKAGEDSNYVTLKYHPTGTRLFAVDYDGTGSKGDVIEDIVVDPLGNVYVTGYSQATNLENDYVTIRYDSAGVEQWIARYNSSFDDDDHAYALALDSLGNVLVTGASLRPAASQSDYITMKYPQDFSSTLEISTQSLDDAFAGVPFVQAVEAFGGSGSRTWNYGDAGTYGDPHPDFSLDTSTGVISGTPTIIGIYNFRVEVVDGALSNFVDLSITVHPGIPAQLGFLQQPGGGPAGQVWAQQPVVKVLDLYGHTVTWDNTTQVNVSISNNPLGNGTLSGNQTLTVSAGQVIYTDLSIDNIGAGYTLEADATGPTFITSDPFDITAEITGFITFNGLPITNETNADAVFFVSGLSSPQTEYNTTTGEYSVYLPPGTYDITVSLDAATPFDGEFYPNDFHGYNTSFVVPGTVTRDLICQRLIHLTDPVDNSIAQHWPGPVYDEYANTVFFDWDDVTEASHYIIDVYTYQSDPYVYQVHPVNGAQRWVSDYTCNLVANLVGQHYQIEISAYNGVALIGKYMSVYVSGYGGDYRYRIVGSQQPTQVSLMGRSNFGAGYLHTLFLESQDTLGNPANVAQDTVFNLNSDSTGIHSFYSNSQGTISITQVTIPAGQNRVYFYYLDDLPGTPTIIASWASGGTTLGSDNEQPLIWAVTGQIVFESDRDGDNEIYIMNADGTGQWAITNNAIEDQSPSWSPSGSHIVFKSSSGGDSEIFRMRTDGSRRQKLTDNDAEDSAPRFSPDASQIVFHSDRDGDDEIFVMDFNGSNVQQLTTNTAIDAQPHWSPDGTKIVFRSERDTNSEIYVMDSNGSNQIRLTNNSVVDWHPSWSPDGLRILFMRDSGNPEIYVMDADGSNETQLTDHVLIDSHPSWSPDGSKIVFKSTRHGNSEIYTMNADGSVATRLTDLSAVDTYPSWGGSKIAFRSNRDGDDEIYIMNADGLGQMNLSNNVLSERNPSWSPDGTKIIFDRGNGIWMMNSDGSGETQLTSGSSEYKASFSPDGSKIVFTRLDGGNYEIYVMNANGTNQINLTVDSNTDVWPSWSPYGSKIVFQRSLSGNSEIFVMNSDGTLQTNLTNDSASDSTPSWSPDSDKIAFTRDNDIYTMNADGTVVTQLTSVGNNIRPAWSADGRKIVFQSNRDTDWEVYIMNADGSGQINISNSDASVDEMPHWRPQARIINPEYEYVSQWGSVGTGDNEFGAPEYITVDSLGNVYVSETDNHRVSKYTSNGTLLGWWGKGSATTGWHDPDSGETARNSGHGDGELNNPRGIAIDSSGDVYVGVTFRVCKFTSTGTFLGWWGYGWKDVVGSYVGWFDPGSGYTPRSGRIVDGGFGGVFGIAIDSSDNIYAVGGNFVQKSQFNEGTYEFLGWWGLDGDGFTGWHDPGALKSSASGIGDGQFYYARDVAVDSSSYVYVTDGHPQQQRVQKFKNDGTFIGWWGHDTTGETGWHAPGSGRTGSIGEGDGQFYNPYGIAVDNEGLVYVINSWRPRFQVFTTDGTYIGWYGKDNTPWTGWHPPGTGLTGVFGDQDGQFSSPFGIVVDPSGNVYVTDGGNSRIQKFRKIER